MTPPAKPLLFSGTANPAFARRLAKELGVKLARVEIGRFSDEETQIVIKEPVKGRDVYVVQSTSMPVNEYLMEMLLLVHAIKALKPKRITAVMPFFGYRRQEKISVNGEALAFQLVAKLLHTAGVSRTIVIDLHKHRSAKFFKEAKIRNKELRAFEVLVEYFKQKKLENFVMLAPDKGAIPESERYARALNVPLVKVYKHRSRTRKDTVSFDRFEGDVKGKNVLIVDDEVNTAGTLIGIVEMLKQRKARNVYFGCTHPVLSGPAIERLASSKIKQVIVTDTIQLPPKKRIKKLKVLSVAPLFAETITKWSRHA